MSQSADDIKRSVQQAAKGLEGLTKSLNKHLREQEKKMRPEEKKKFYAELKKKGFDGKLSELKHGIERVNKLKDNISKL